MRVTSALTRNWFVTVKRLFAGLVEVDDAQGSSRGLALDDATEVAPQDGEPCLVV